MANTKSASKRARQGAVRTLRNRSVLTRLRGLHKKTMSGGGEKDAAKISALVSAVDKAAKRGVIHRNAANRRKARLNKLRSAASAPAA
ncbi:MAG: 30S ribosomal protein S20 [Verrucomicrobiota bacterium]|nr:30S ribosomal protein S20 [Verrucomicrobiota bacterium]